MWERGKEEREREKRGKVESEVSGGFLVSQEQGSTDVRTSNADEGTTQVRKMGRPKGSKNRIRRSCDESTTNHEPYLAAILISRRSRARGDTVNNQVGEDVNGGERGRGRGRGQGRGLGRGMETS
ncbi:uncharacterized protein A4U43_C05F28180 [Asparagus officinalis]|uniref:Uncharacterized protein n=1 Tax=Asparagus officinalis TaxID=4686 RepID=A0A5P1EV26_ASPOF|nr:uncharacterized protein A4U43_C05F28180 [Asparagus officinalis]